MAVEAWPGALWLGVGTGSHHSYDLRSRCCSFKFHPILAETVRIFCFSVVSNSLYFFVPFGSKFQRFQPVLAIPVKFWQFCFGPYTISYYFNDSFAVFFFFKFQRYICEF